MMLTSVRIRNFKAISDANIDLSSLNLIVGANGSGKSSVLQALHWMFQSARNPKIEARQRATDGATLSEKDATFMPSPDYRNAGHGQEYGNFQGAPKLDVSVTAMLDDGTTAASAMWIKSARNEGISVHVPSGNSITSIIRDPRREFSAYIPGLAGIPLIEEKRSKLVVQRLAAAGDANTVLRNVLHLLSLKEVGGRNGLEVVQELASEVMGKFSIELEFDDGSHTSIQARFQTDSMRSADARRLKPLELAGIGFLQVVQIFAYLVYFRPVVLLVDEPDAHLHPTAQERLVVTLARACAEFGTQVLMTTHSPSVVRALPPHAKVIWMKDGAVEPDGDSTARNLMGWGLLDRKVLLLTEDTGSAMLRTLLAQWPSLERNTAVWPFHGTGKLPPPDTIKGIAELFGGTMKVVIHRDRDFLMDEELEAIIEPYRARGVQIWVTEGSDIEAFWCNVDVIKQHFDVAVADAEACLEAAVTNCQIDDADLHSRRRKRIDAMQKIPEAQKGRIRHFNDAEVLAHTQANGKQHCIVGKTLLGAIRAEAQRRGWQNISGFGKVVPDGLGSPLAAELEQYLRVQN